MLIEFSVTNFRSFREKQTFSMAAVPRLGKKGNVFKPDVKGEKKIPSLLKIAAIYGPNASGKSNLIKALGIIQSLLKHKTSELLPVAPFRFDPSLVDQPSRFEFHFIVHGQRYEFMLAATQERIIEEQLVSYPKGKETLLYKRQYIASREVYIFGDTLEGGEVLHDAWRNLTSSRMLFIYQAVTNSSDELQQLRIPYLWLNMHVRTIPRNMSNLTKAALSIGSGNPSLNFEKHISSFLNEIDVPISDIQFEVEDNSEKGNEPARLSDNSNNNHIRSSRDTNELDELTATFTHTTALGDAKFDFSEESDGTKNLIGFSLPWHLMGIKQSPLQVLIIDELDSSLHPKIVACLIEKLLKFDPPVQLIFTTHDTHLMDTKLLRRDQYWLTERDMNGATQLRSIHDFDGRESEDVEKRYYEGRYRGLPILRKG